MTCAVKVTKDPSTSVMTEAEEEVSHDETSTHEEFEPEQEVSINHPHLNAPLTVYTNTYMPYNEGLKMIHYTKDFSSGNSSVRTF